MFSFHNFIFEFQIQKLKTKQNYWHIDLTKKNEKSHYQIWYVPKMFPYFSYFSKYFNDKYGVWGSRFVHIFGDVVHPSI